MPKDTKEIGNKKENRLGWIAFFVLTIHFGLILFSIFPQTSATAKISSISEQYASPLFKQKWSMFAPCPIFENRFKVKLYFNNDTTDWLDPIDHILTKHQQYRFTYHGNIAVGYYNMLFWFKTELDQLQIPSEELLIFSDLPSLRNSLGNRLLNNYVNGYISENFDESPLKVDLDISYKNVISEKVNHFYFTDYR